ncbi:type II toxin-antitoxin system RelE/ParE family toxin [Minwuia sp.]|uniref:type II toxin-antitoxin system RelE/ParE family toxin n=1 Tax=Minwuia sp. TaxID=2493630 RepID=UPI003A8DC7AA
MIVRLSRRAERDLEEITAYIAEDNPERAESFARELYGRCLALSEFPEASAVWKRSPQRIVRRVVHGNYLIFYSVEKRTVRIQRILHGARNIRRLL